MRTRGWWVAGLLALTLSFYAGVVLAADSLWGGLALLIPALAFWGVSHMHDDADSLAMERRGLMKKAAKLDKKVADLGEREDLIRRMSA